DYMRNHTHAHHPMSTPVGTDFRAFDKEVVTLGLGRQKIAESWTGQEVSIDGSSRNGRRREREY
ncbi:hypothetical protein, partial [Streptomyces clavifer]|uniref:hypothetical protein n=1 Tax=Streptomyces clavifer TaxID=68188 RepID=UPI0033F4D5A5